MILHTVSMVAVFVDQIAQAPVVVQCAPNVPESWVKWLLPTIVQTVISLASIAAGVLIAIWSFRASSRKEHQNWVLDQKKEEWREILSAINACQKSLPLISTLSEQLIGQSSIASEEHEKVLKAQQTIFDRLFIDARAIYPVMSGWNNINEKARATSPGRANEFADAYLVFVNQVRNAARRDLDAEGAEYPEIDP